MKKWAVSFVAAGALLLGAGWAMAGGISSDPAAKAVRDFYAAMDKDGMKARLETCAPVPRGAVFYLEDEYSGYPDWQVFQTTVYISDVDGGKRHHWETIVVKDWDSGWKVAGHGAGI